jgi:putative intracellular protease/amidase
MTKTGKKILMVLTSSRTMGESDEPTGLWLEEFTVPYYALLDAGCEVTVVSTAGGEVPIDPRSLGEEAERIEENRLYHDDGAARAALTHSPALSEVDASEFDAIFLPGGHGTMWDLPQSDKLARDVSALYAAGKPVAAVCHGPAGLVNATTPEGEPLVKGKRVSAFLTAEEEAVGLKDAVPFLLDERLSELGATVVRGEPFVETAVADGLLITGQNPQSAAKVAELLVEALHVR